MKLNFATAFHKGYLLKGMALLSSIRRYHPEARTTVLCLDDYTFDTMVGLKLPCVELISLRMLESWYPALLRVKGSRSGPEYAWTCYPHLIRALVEIYTIVIQIDPDVYLLSRLDAALVELGSGSCLLVEQRFSTDRENQERSFGRFDAGLVFHGPCSVAVEWWMRRCLEKCSSQPEPGHFGDQKYLDEWPKLFGGVVVSKLPGLGLGEWNVSDYQRSEFLSYHFSGLPVPIPFTRPLTFSIYGYPIPEVVFEKIYEPYFAEVENCQRLLLNYTFGLNEPWDPVYKNHG